MVSYSTARKKVPALRRMGTWATWWWAVSGLYIVVLVWQSKDVYTAGSVTSMGFSASRWVHAIRDAFAASGWLQFGLLVIGLAWFAGLCIWLSLLSQYKVRYREALVDLVFTVRR